MLSIPSMKNKISNLDAEVLLVLNVSHASDWWSLGVNFSLEHGCGVDVGHHVSGVAVDADVVAGGKLVSGGLLDG